MNKFGQSAIRAAKACQTRQAPAPREAWNAATSRLFGKGTASQRKGSPRDAFLGLCEEGLVKGIPAGNYSKSIKNKKHALDAVAALQRDASLASSPKEMWETVTKRSGKKHNSQMDVVVALWNEGYIESKR